MNIVGDHLNIHFSHELIDIKEGTMYPILYKLLDENYISSYEKVIERKVRVYYHIEEKGKEKLLEMINRCFNFIYDRIFSILHIFIPKNTKPNC